MKQSIVRDDWELRWFYEPRYLHRIDMFHLPCGENLADEGVNPNYDGHSGFQWYECPYCKVVPSQQTWDFLRKTYLLIMG